MGEARVITPPATAAGPVGERVGRRERVQSIDILRGAIMIIMALDHTRDFTHWAATQFTPENLTRTWPALFLTRWITHFCAPMFMFTAGLGAYLWMQRGGRTKGELSRFLLTRGLWLIVLDVTVSRFSLNFSLDYSVLILLVLWALGACMVMLAGLIHLPTRWLTVVSIAFIALHNLTDKVKAAQFGSLAPLWNILHDRSPIKIGNHLLIVGYTLMPWFAVMALGYCCGVVFTWAPERRQRFLVRIGLATTIAFVVLRAINIYGDPSRWATQKSAAMTLVSFLNTTKYPPSLLFLLMTVGPALVVMGWLEHVRLRESNPLIVFGRTPLFFFLIHMFIGHLLAVAMDYARYHQFFWDPLNMTGKADLPPGFGWSLWTSYAAWITVVLLSYPLCRWYAGLKKAGRYWWLSYL